MGKQTGSIGIKMDIFPAKFVVVFFQMLIYHYVNSASQNTTPRYQKKSLIFGLNNNDEL